MGVIKEQWGITPDGEAMESYTLFNEAGMQASISTYGGVVTRLIAPDRHGIMADVTLGYDRLEQYLDDECFLGCLVGRVANRIGNARFMLNGTEYLLDANNGAHQLHGGSQGFHTRVWQAETGTSPEGPQLTLARVSEDGEQGYPGTLDVRVTFTLLNHGLRIDFCATPDKTTVVSMTNHSYFNLSGQPGVDCLGHEVTIPASRILKTNEDQIPTGVLADVAGTPFDFRSPLTIGTRIGEENAGLDIGQGYDHYYVLDDETDDLKLAASVYEPESGRGMEVWTTHPGLQFYSGNHLPKSLPGKGGVDYSPQCAFCLEAHGYVNAPNNPGFPSMVVNAGQAYFETIEYRFFTK